MIVLEHWKESQEAVCTDQLKRFVFQNREEETADSLPHVLKQIPRKRTVNGLSSPHQMGDHVCYDMLIRGPLYCSTCHFIEVPPNFPTRGRHRHIGAPTLFCMKGKGWEWNDGETYYFGVYDLLVPPPYTIHQHGGDKEIGGEIFVPETGRIDHLLGLMWREQHKLTEKPEFPQGTEPIQDGEGKLLGYRIKKGVLGIKEDIEVILGPEPSREAAFQARRSAGSWEEPMENTYDRYLNLFHEEAAFCRKVEHVIRDEDLPWESTRQGKIKWMIHPETETATNHAWIYFQEIPAGSRSGRHRHVSEELVLVLEGRGYDIHDGVRWDWEQGDMICIPPMTDHQHFSLGDSRTLLLNSMPSIYTNLGLGAIEQLEDAPE